MCDCEELEFEDFELVLAELSKAARTQVSAEAPVIAVPSSRKAR